jgi:hypothetical protein
MTEKDQIHTLLADLAGEDPPVDIDLDQQIRLGRRRNRYRTAALCVTAVAVPAVLLGGILTLRPDNTGSTAPAATTNSSPPLPNRTVTKPDVQSTTKSQALRAQVLKFIPEIRQTPGGRIFDMEFGDPMGSIHAGADWIWQEQANQVTISVVVARRGTEVPCGGPNRCTQIRTLPDGSTAYLSTYIVPNSEGHSYDVRLDRPDGTSVSVSSSALKPKGAKHDAPLSLNRVLEIAQQITVKP